MNIAKLIKDAVEKFNCQVGLGDVSFRESYSGRGMYGRECVGITGHEDDCRKVIAMVINDARDSMGPDSDFDFHGMVDSLLDFKRDSMGFDVILYWEDIQQEGDDGEEALFVNDIDNLVATGIWKA
jgi:hypothetical protein